MGIGSDIARRKLLQVFIALVPRRCSEAAKAATTVMSSMCKIIQTLKTQSPRLNE